MPRAENHKFQTQNSTLFEFGICLLGFIWNREFEIWNFPEGAMDV
jgi:hypothetical protein